MTSDKVSRNKIVDKYVYECFCQMRSNRVPQSGPVLKSETLEIAGRLEIKNFKAFIAWLDRFRKKHVTSFKCLNDTSASVNADTVNEW